MSKSVDVATAEAIRACLTLRRAERRVEILKAELERVLTDEVDLKQYALATTEQPTDSE